MPYNLTHARRRYALSPTAWGRNMLAGKTLRAQNSAPVPGVVWLLQNPFFTLARFTRPDPATGAYLFEYIAEGSYTVIADDAAGVFNSAIARPVASEPMVR
ncbi:hypothetical protein FACS1894185_3420 [Betaproteobacteria bacterium]|nr:hypothetical protein FACS1894185_3420 [Betaproteobacteria bacterium]